MPERPYFDTDATCPKCGGDDITARHQANAHAHGCRDHAARREPECCTDEHICRHCRRCGWGWSEKPLDLPLQGRHDPLTFPEERNVRLPPMDDNPSEYGSFSSTPDVPPSTNA